MAPTPNYENRWRAFSAIGVAFVSNVIAMSMIFVALPSIADDFGISLRTVAWVVIAQSLTISSLMLPMGRVADIIGRKRMHLMGLGLFGLGSVAVAMAPTFGLLIAARVLMSAGSAMGQSVGTAMVVAVFPPEQRSTAIGSQTTAVAIGSASGPILAGLILQVLPWRALFLLLLIPIAIAMVAGVIILDEAEVTPESSRRSTAFDWGGVLLSSAVVATLVLTINDPFGFGFGSGVLEGGVLLTMVLLATFISHELSTQWPMIDLRLFSNRVFSTAVAARLAGFMGSSTVMLMVPVFLISLRGMQEAAAGGILLLNSIGMGVSAQAAGRLSDRRGPRGLMLSGYAMLFATAIGLTFMTKTTALPWMAVAMLFSGLSMGMWNVPNNSTIIGSVDPSEHGVVGALTNLIRNLGNVFGQAIASAVVVAIMVGRGFDVPLNEIENSVGAGDAFSAGWRVSFMLVAVFGLIGLALTYSAPRTAKPASSRP